MDRAVVYALLSRAWQMLAGPVTIFMIARQLSAEVQGFYYTFASLLALQSFVELGFYIVIINISSHEWSQLRLNGQGEVEGHSGALSRLISLGRLIFRWYAVAAVIFVAAVSVVGYVFFSGSDYSEIHWQAPWFSVVTCTGLLLWMLPFNSLLEGCNQVATINLFRFIQAVGACIALWLALLLNWGLWAAVAMAATRLVTNSYLLGVTYRSFFKSFFRHRVMEKMCWKSEVWPMQWRLALSGVVNYFAFSLFSPVMFYYHGATVAGAMGMTWQIVMALLTVGAAWITAKVPQFGMLIAQRQFVRLDRLWLKTSIIAFVVVFSGAIVLWTAIYALYSLETDLSRRVLSPLPTGLLLVSCLFMLVSQCQTAYLRAHKKEPIVVMSVTTSLLTGLAVFFLGRHYGPLGAAGGHLVVTVLAVIWGTSIWFRCRRSWHQNN